MVYDSFRPGQIWLDNTGQRIQAHGGSVYSVDGKYYWIGENKELTDGANGIWHNGVRCYSSMDLYNWADEGIIIPASEDSNSTLHRSSQMDRPHIIYNRKTQKYVCWLKIMGKDGTQDMTVLKSDSLLGPYELYREHLKPFDMSSGDFDLAVDKTTEKAYWYFENVHRSLICADLNESYDDVTGYYSEHFIHDEGVPYVREAPAHFEYKGKHYLATSGTTGYYPNPSEIAVADDYHGPFTILGSFHLGKDSETSFRSQVSSIFRVEETDKYIAVADRWLVNSDIPYEKVKAVFELYSQDRMKEALELVKSLDLSPENTSIADYVWLPVIWEGNYPHLEWCNEWRLENL